MYHDHWLTFRLESRSHLRGEMMCGKSLGRVLLSISCLFFGYGKTLIENGDNYDQNPCMGGAVERIHFFLCKNTP
jgi:hypothetical protein